MEFSHLQEKVHFYAYALIYLIGYFGSFISDLVGYFRAWARDGRERFDGPPRGREGFPVGEHEPHTLSRHDVGVLIEEFFKSDRVTQDFVEAKMLPLHAKP